MSPRLPRGRLMLWPAPVPRQSQFATRHDWTQVAQAWERLNTAYAHAYGSRHVPAPPSVTPPLPPATSTNLRPQLEAWVGWHNRQITQLGGQPVPAWDWTVIGGGDDLAGLSTALGLPGQDAPPLTGSPSASSPGVALAVLAVLGALAFF